MKESYTEKSQKLFMCGTKKIISLDFLLHIDVAFMTHGKILWKNDNSKININPRLKSFVNYNRINILIFFSYLQQKKKSLLK